MYNKNLNDLIREFMNEDVFGGSLTEFRFPKAKYNNVKKNLKKYHRQARNTKEPIRSVQTSRS